MTGRVEVDEGVGMGRDWVTATAAAEAALARLFCVENLRNLV